MTTNNENLVSTAQVSVETVQFTDLASAEQSGGKGLQFWGIDTDGEIWTIYQQTPGGSWSDWYGPGFYNQPVAASKITGAGQNTGCLIFFMLDLSGNVWSIPQLTPGGSWGSWSGPGIANQPKPFYQISAAEQSGNRGVQLNAVAADGEIWVLYQTTPGGAWSKWEGPGFKSQPETMTLVTLAGQNNGDLILFSTNDDYSVWCIKQLSPGGNWGSWTGPNLASQPVPFYQISAAEQSGNRGVSLKTIAADGNMWVLYQTTPGGSWSKWEGPGFKKQPTPMKLLTQASQGNGCLRVFTIDLQNNLWTIPQLSPGGDWGAWSKMTLPVSIDIQPEPAGVYPIPNLYGSVIEHEVNLFTGDVNFSLPLAVINDGNVSYSLDIFYNSRGAAYAVAPDNSLFSSSWKLMDYPKIVSSDSGMFFLDGYAAYPLTTSDNINYATNNKYNPWRFSLNSGVWFITTDKGLQYKLANTSTLESGSQAWNLTSFTDLSWPSCALQFTYSGGNITGITNSLGVQVIVAYSGEGQLISATNQTVINGVTTQIGAATLTYSNNLLASLTISKQTAVGLTNTLPPYIFGYTSAVTGYSSGYTNVLTSVQNPEGGQTLFTYYAQPEGGTSGSPYPVGYFPVVAVQENTQTGQSKSALFSYAGYKMDDTDVYTQWNNANVYPGAISNTDTAVSTVANIVPLFGSNAYYFFNGNPNNYSGDAAVATNPVSLGTCYINQSNIPLTEQVWNQVDTSTSTILNVNVTPPAYGICKILSISATFTDGYVGQPISINVTDADGDIVAVASVMSESGTNPINLTLSVPTEIAEISVSSDFITGGGTATIGPYTFYLEVDETTDASSQIDLLLSVQDSRIYNIGTNAAAQSFLKEVTSTKTKGNTTTVTNTTYGNDTTLPYPITVSQIVEIPQADGTAVNTNLTKNYVYAVQEYPDLDQINLRTPIAQVQKLASEEGSATSTCTGAVTTQWKQFTTALGQYAGWGPWRTYKLYNDSFTDGFAATPDSNWLLTNTIQQRNSRGLALSSLNVNDIVTSQLLGTNGAIQVATFKNADVNSNQAGWISFEAYESMTNWTYSSGATIVSGQSYTGKNCLSGTYFTLNAQTFTPTSGVAYVAGCYVLLQSGASCELAFYNSSNGTVGATVSMNYDASNTGWRYIQCIMASPAAGYLPSLKVTGTGSVNNMFFAPVSGEFSAFVWNINQQQTTASLGYNGAVTQQAYDAMGSGIALATPGRNLSMVQSPFSSVLGQYWLNGAYTFSADQPNQTLCLRTPDAGYWDAFTSQTTTLFPSANLTNMTMTANHLLAGTASTSSASPSYASCSKSPSQADFAVTAEVLMGSATGTSGNILGLTVTYTAGGAQVFFGFNGQSLVLMELSSNTVLDSATFDNLPAATVLTLLVRNGKALYGYVAGNLLLQYDLTTAVAGPVGVRTTWLNSAFYNFGLLSGPELSNATNDGSNNNMQFLSSINGTNTNISQSLRSGNLNRPTASTLTTNVTAPGLAPISNFAVLDATSSTPKVTASSSINDYWSADYQQAPFASSMLFYNAPIALTGSRGKGGEYTAGTSGSSTYYYGQTGDVYYDLSPELYLVSMSQSATGAQVTTMTSPTGIIAGKIRTDDPNDINLVTNFSYGNNLLKTGTYYPGSWAGGSNSEVYYSDWAYSFIGLVDNSSTTDGGTTHYLYNTAGQQRLLQTAAGAAAPTPYCVYTQYDSLGRVTAQGTWNGLLSSVTDAQINDPSWPADGTVQNSFVWDWNGNQYSVNPAMGRLVQSTAALTNNVGNWQQNFTYDAAGNTVNIATYMLDSYTTLVANLTQGFDGLNRLTSLTDAVSGYNVVYSYDEQGRIIAVGNSSAPDAFATYTYENGTVVETLLGGKLIRTYTINALGQIESIVDSFFQEELFYAVRANGNAGYLNGQIASAQCTFAATCVNQSGTPIGTITEEYTYDNFGRLKNSQSSLGSDYSFGVSYNANGNITSLADGAEGTTTYNYNANTNKLGSTSDGQSYGYDASGNTITVTGAANLSLSYDAVSGQPSTISNNATAIAFSYDASGQRIARVATDGTTYYVKDGQGRVIVETDGKNATAFYIYGAMGRIAMMPQDGSGNISYDIYLLLNDHLGSPRVVVDGGTGTPVAWYNYDPYGEMVEYLSNSGDIGLNYLFTGQQLDPDFKVYDFNARLYDPTVCRFYSPDPLHQFASPYIYTNNPISFEDPTGEWFGWDDAIAIGGGALIGGLLEAAREAAAGEKLSWRNIALGAAVGAAAGEVALYTGGAGITGVGALQTLAMGAATGAAIGGSIGLVTGGITAAVTGDTSQISKQAINGAITGAQSGLLSGFFAQAARWVSPIYRTGTTTTIGIVDNPYFGNRLSYTFAEWTYRSMGVGAASGGVNAVIQGFVHNDSWSKIALNAVIGAATGAFTRGTPNAELTPNAYQPVPVEEPNPFHDL